MVGSVGGGFGDGYAELGGCLFEPEALSGGFDGDEAVIVHGVDGKILRTDNA